MRTIELKSWADFSAQLADIRARRKELEAAERREFDAPLFRGVGSSDWGLETTLERAVPLELAQDVPDLQAYYKLISKSKSSVETLSDADWGNLPNPLEFLTMLSQFETLGAQFFFINNVPLYRYLIYLRHHGYPSPLLDWTASPHVAAFFAFDSMPKTARSVSVYSMLRDRVRLSSAGQPTVDIMGPFVRTHRRHLIQQCQYSVCMMWHAGYKFCSHDEAFAEPGTLGIKGELVRIAIPAEERDIALAELDQMNINAFSLFGSEDSLVRTIARRDGLLSATR